MCMMIYAKSYSTESEGLNKELSHLFLDFYVAGRPPASVFEFFLSFFFTFLTISLRLGLAYENHGLALKFYEN